MWYCGLRGAMAYALALDAADTFKEEGNIILTLTVVVIALNVNYIVYIDIWLRIIIIICIREM